MKNEKSIIEVKESKNKEIAGSKGKTKEKDCPLHGGLKTHGKFFEGIVKKKFQKRVVIEFERMVYIRKYERYAKSKTKIHSRLPECMENQIKVGDYIRVHECRPLSKLIHSVVVSKISGAEK